MKATRLGPQGDLFTVQTDCRNPLVSLEEPPPEDFIERIRAELIDMLNRVRSADASPWTEPTRALLSELRFRSIVHWLPPNEASSLLAAFEVELQRLYGPEETDEIDDAPGLCRGMKTHGEAGAQT